MDVKISVAKCPHCGESFKALKDGKIPTHDFPKPCRQVCRGSGQYPKSREDTPLWKDDSDQEARDFLDGARQELLIYGFAVVKQMAAYLGETSGTMECPLCQQDLKFSIAPTNQHCRAKCSTEKCINIVE